MSLILDNLASQGLIVGGIEDEVNEAGIQYYSELVSLAAMFQV